MRSAWLLRHLMEGSQAIRDEKHRGAEVLRAAEISSIKERVPRSLYLACVLVASLLPKSALAEQVSAHGVSLDWRAPSECPRAADVLSRVSGSSNDQRQAIVAVAAVSREGEAWVLSLSTEQGGVKGGRTLTSDSCEELARAAAVLLSLMLSPDGAGSVLFREPRPTAPPTPAPRPEPTPAAPEPEPTRLELGAGWVTELGVLPRGATGPTLEVGIAWRDARIAVSGFWALAREQELEGQARVGGRLGHARVATTVCWSPWTGGWGLDPCGALEVGATWAEGFGVSTPISTASWWVAPKGMVVGWVRSDHVRLSLGASLGAPLSRPSFYLEPYGELYQPDIVFFGTEVVLSYRFR